MSLKVENPHLAFQVAGVDAVDSTVAVEVRQRRGRKTVAVSRGAGIGVNLDVITGIPAAVGASGNVEDEQLGLAVAIVVVAITEDRDPASVVGQADLGPAVGVAQVDIVIVPEFP